jgi:hypothetical protein
MELYTAIGCGDGNGAGGVVVAVVALDGGGAAPVLVDADGRVVHQEHHLAGVPEHGVGVEVGRGVEPQVDALLPVAHALDVQVRLHQVRLAGDVAQELEVELVVLVPSGRQLRIVALRRECRFQFHIHRVPIT